MDNVFAVKFEDVVAGWMNFQLISSQKNYSTRFTDMHDPLLAFKRWLELLADEQTAVFSFDTEEKIVEFSWIKEEESMFLVTEIENGKREQILSLTISAKELLTAFYRAFFEFIQSESYRALEWQGSNVLDEMGEKYQFSETELLDLLGNLNRKEIKEFLSYEGNFEILLEEESANPRKDFLQILEIIKSDADLDTLEGVTSREDAVFDLPKNYDLLSLEEKRQFICDSLQSGMVTYGGTHPEVVRSQKVELFLEK